MRSDDEELLFDKIDGYIHLNIHSLRDLWSEISSNELARMVNVTPTEDDCCPEQTTNVLQYIFLSLQAPIDAKLFLMSKVIEIYPSIAYETNANPDKKNKDFAWWLMTEESALSTNILMNLQWDFSRINKGGNTFLHQLEDADLISNNLITGLKNAAKILHDQNCKNSIDSIGYSPSKSHLLKGNPQVLDFLSQNALYIHDPLINEAYLHVNTIGWYRMQKNFHIMTKAIDQPSTTKMALVNINSNKKRVL